MQRKVRDGRRPGPDAGGGVGVGACGQRGPDSGVSAALCWPQAGAVGAGEVTPSPCRRWGCPGWATNTRAPANSAVWQGLSLHARYRARCREARDGKFWSLALANSV